MANQINKTHINISSLDTLIKDMGKKISIKVGILEPQANEKHPDSDLTMAEIGAVHEFGARIPVTKKMRNYLHSQGVHLKKDTTDIIIPTRSFLRMPLLSKEGKKAIQKNVRELYGTKRTIEEIGEISSEGASQIIDDIAHLVAESALMRVQEAFTEGGLGNWAPITTYTRNHRTGNPQAPPLTDEGILLRKISYKVEELK